MTDKRTKEELRAEVFKKFPVDARGHDFVQDRFLDPDGVMRVEFLDTKVGDEDVFYTCIDPRLNSGCSICGDYIGLKVPVNAVPGIDFARPSTKCPGAPQTTVTEVDFPSGKILVADAVRGNWPYCTTFNGPHSYNSKVGQQEVIIGAAKANTAFGSTGNQGLGLYRYDETHYQVISAGWSEDVEDEEVVPEGAVEVASICTDLWAYTIVDYGYWILSGSDPEKLGWTETVVDIIPGRYRITYHGHEDGFERDGGDPAIFADMRLVEKFDNSQWPW